MAKFKNLVVESLAPLENCHAIAVIGNNPREGATTATLSLASNLVKNLSSSVLVVDADFRHPSLHRLLKLSASPGLSDLLADPSRPIDGMVQKTTEGFDVLTAGAEESQTATRLANGALEQVVAALKDRYEYVLFDMSPVSRFPAISKALSALDGTIMVVACEQTRWEVAQNTKENIESAGSKVLGVLMNKRRYYIPGWLYRFV